MKFFIVAIGLALVSTVYADPTVTTNGLHMTVNCNGATELTSSHVNEGKTDDDTPITGLTFENCDTLTTLGEYAFEKSEIENHLELPPNVVTIGGYAFKNAQLTSVNIPDKVQSIGDQAFSNSPLVSLTLPDSLTSLGLGSFGAWMSGTKYGSVETLVTLHLGGGWNPINSGNGDYFEDHLALETLTIGEGVTSVGAYAFNYAPLVSLTIPNSVTTIIPRAFGYVSGDTKYGSISTLRTLHLGGGWNPQYDSNGIFSKHEAIETLTIAEGVTEIDAATFARAPLVTITLPNSLNTIGYYAFGRNDENLPHLYGSVFTLKTLHLGGGWNPVSHVSYNGDPRVIFYDHAAIETLTIGEGVTEIGSYSFQYAPLTTLTLPEGLKKIQQYAFKRAKLESLTIPASVTEIRYYVFQESPLVTLNILSNSVYLEGHPFHGSRTTLKTLHINGFDPDYSDFGPFTKIETLTMGDSVTSIKTNAFKNSPIRSLTLGESVTSIGNDAFMNAVLDTLVLPSSLTTIGTSDALINIATIIVPPNLNTVGSSTLRTGDCGVAIYEHRSSWSNTPVLCNKQINLGGSPCSDFACPAHTARRYSVTECAGDPCTKHECCGIPYEPTLDDVFPEEYMPTIKTATRGATNMNCKLK